MCRNSMIAVVITVSMFAPTIAKTKDGLENQNNSAQIVNASQLTLAEAIRRTNESNPQLRASSYRLAVFAGAVTQASVFNNPNVEFEAEDLVGSGAYGDAENAEFSFLLAQPVPLSGKRRHAKQLSLSNLSVEQHRIQAENDLIVADLTKAFIAALAAQERERIFIVLVPMFEQAVRTIQRRMAAGASNYVDLAKAEIALAMARIDHSNATLKKMAAFRDLSAYWGANIPDFQALSAILDHYQAPPDITLILTAINQSPALLNRTGKIETARKALALEKSRRAPDLTLSAGLKYRNESNDTTLRAGISLPLPLFDRNQGNVVMASNQIAVREFEAEAFLLQYESDLTEKWYTLQAFLIELDALKQTILPQAQIAYDYSRQLFQNGQLSYLELLDAQRTFSEQQLRQIETLAAYHSVVADIEGQLGISFDEIKTYASTTFHNGVRDDTKNND